MAAARPPDPSFRDGFDAHDTHGSGVTIRPAFQVRAALAASTHPIGFKTLKW